MNDGKYKILSVDDDEAVRKTLFRILSKEKYSVIAASSGEEALSILDKEKIMLIISDIMMPGIKGDELCRIIKEKYNIPVILLTGLTAHEDILNGLKNGADEFIHKPFFPEELLQRIKNLLKIKDYQDSLEEKVIIRTKQLQKSYTKFELLNKDVLNRLLTAAEFRDGNTGMHVIRVGKYSRIISESLGIDNDFSEMIEQIAPMHDIGKIGISDLILLKPAKLTIEEFNIMKEHTVIGAKLLEKSDSILFKSANVVALTHHEKWDGTGYPRGLAGEQIPLVGRIIMLADIFDALTSERPYKKAFSFDDSIKIIKKDIGTFFDSVVADAFFKSINDIRAVYETLRDNY